MKSENEFMSIVRQALVFHILRVDEIWFVTLELWPLLKTSDITHSFYRLWGVIDIFGWFR